MDLVSKFWNFCHTLRHEGVDYIDYIEELTYLLFLKIANERDIKIPDGCNWNDLIIHDQEDLLKRYNQILSELSKEKNILGDIFSQPMAKIRNASSLKKLLILIDEVNWTEFNKDVLGSMFEGLLEKAANESKKGAGQYFTPRPLIETIVSVMKPNPFETSGFKITDVACGTAGFIISSFEWWKNNNDLNSLDSISKNKIFQSTYYGQELVVRPRRMAQMNLYLHGVDPNIKLGDTIYEPLSDERYTCILTNPPFGSKGSNQIPDRNDFKVKTSNKQLNFVQHVISALEDKGRTAIVLPDNVLFEDKATELWEHLMLSCNVHTVLRLPNGTFTPYAQGVKANVIFIQKGIPTSDIWIFDARSNIEAVTKIDRPLTRNHFKEFENCYGENPNGLSKREEQDRFRKFTVKEIHEQNYRLDFTWLEDLSGEKDYNEITSEDLIREAISRMNEMLSDLKDVLTQIEK